MLLFLSGPIVLAKESDAEEVFPGFGGPDARAAAVVDLGLEDRDELIERLAKLPPLL